MRINRLIYISSIDNYKSSLTFHIFELKQAEAFRIIASAIYVKW